MTMPLKGVVVVPADMRQSWPGEHPGTQRVANRPLVCHALDSLLAAGITTLAVVAPAAAIPEIRACVEGDATAGRQVTFLAQGPREDLLGALLAAAAFVGEDPSVAHFADGLLGQPLEPFTEIPGQDAPDLLLLLHHGVDDRERLGPATQRLLGVSELDGSRTRLALAGVCVFGPGAMGRAAQAAPEGDATVDLISIAEALAAQGRTLEAGFTQSWRRYSGDPLDLLELNRVVLDQQAPQPAALQRGDNRVEGRVIIHPTADVSSSTILGPSIIGAGARVSHSYIGPYTSVGAGADIEDAEVAGSIVSEGVRIKHIGGRIEASTIGRGASIIRDFQLPRAMRLQVGEGVEVLLD